ncbi:MAG: nucleoside hydrolase [Actinomycetota bacterium]|nr:nucleoside hydrolase [Actinomycetota bacterium]
MEKIIIDADPAIGYTFRDVDDALAILYLLAHPEEFEVLGITAVHGNASVRKTSSRAKEIIGIAGRSDVPVFYGASSSKMLGTPTPASRFLIDTVTSNPGEVTILSIAPLTNVATAGVNEEKFYECTKGIVFMGGIFEKQPGIPFLPTLEFNFFKDSRACELVLDSPCEKVLLTADLCRQAVFTRRDFVSLKAIGNTAATYLLHGIESWLRLNQVSPFAPRKEGFVPWDLIAAIYLRKPNLFSEVESVNVGLKRGRFARGALERAPESKGEPTQIPHRIDGDAIISEFLESMRNF